MKQIHFCKVEDKNNINFMIKEWEKSLSAPIDDYYDYMIDSGVHWTVKKEEEIIGYFSIDNKNKLRQFFLLPFWLDDAEVIFKEMIGIHEIKEAYIATNNLIFLSIAMHLQESVEINSYLFTSFLEGNQLEHEGKFRLATFSDLDDLVEFNEKEVGAPKDWARDYISKWIEREEYFVLKSEEEILGICEVRTTDERPRVACLGMVVSSNHRRKGLGTFLLGKAKKIALERNHEPICSCDKDNIGSLKAIQANGFRAKHQMLKITFP